MKKGSAAQPVRSTGWVMRLVCVQAAHTNTSLPAGAASGGPKELLPPGAATLMTERPKFVQYAGASILVHGPLRTRFGLGLVALASEVGPVAATQITEGVLQNV